MAKNASIQNESVTEQSAAADFIRLVMNWSIAALSIAVIGGFGYWAFSLGSRNPNDVPIIRAMEGPARVQPDNPGGEQAKHQGLAVNSVQADGGVQVPPNQVALAPAPRPLSAEDLANANLTAQAAPPLETAPTIPDAAPGPDTAPVVDEIARAIAQDQAQPEPIAVPALPRLIAGTAYSPATSLRPLNRPARLSTQLAQVQATVASPNQSESIDSVPLGTRLIQLGAYDSTALAIKQWDKLFGKHGDLLEGKKRLVQAAESGGRKFFRLRAAGFASKDETRTLCSALLARGTPCIPVTAR